MDEQLVEYDLERELGLALEALNPKQREFWRLLEMGKTRADAYRTAFSPKSSKVAGKACDLMRSPRFKILREAKQAMLTAQFGLDTANILKTYCILSYFDTREFYNEDGTFKHPKDLTRDQAMAISGIESEEMHVGKTVLIKTKIKFINRKDSLDSLAKTQGMFFEADPEAKRLPWVVRAPREKTVSEWNEEHPVQVLAVAVGNGEVKGDGQT